MFGKSNSRKFNKIADGTMSFYLREYKTRDGKTGSYWVGKLIDEQSGFTYYINMNGYSGGITPVKITKGRNAGKELIIANVSKGR